MIKNNFPNLILLGAPGAGKGTLSDYLINKFNYVHLSTGNLFREAIKKNSTHSKLITDLVKQGKLIPDFITNDLIEIKIKDLLIANKHFILDGYPRTINQANFLKSICDIDKVIFIKIDQDLAIKRIIGRVSCSKCNKGYNLYFFPPKKENICDVCGGQLIKRSDDNENTVKQRFLEYSKNTLPLLDFYEKQHKLFRVFSSDESINEFCSKVDKIIQNRNDNY